MSDLEQRILDAHEAGDKSALVTVYAEASRQASDLDAACFFAVYAHTFALEIEHPLRAELHAFLKQHGREV